MNQQVYHWILELLLTKFNPVIQKKKENTVIPCGFKICVQDNRVTLLRYNLRLWLRLSKKATDFV